MTPAGYCQRWNTRRARWRHTDEPARFRPDRYTVAPASTSDARQLLERHHYLGGFSADKLRYGLTDTTTGALVGVMVLGSPQSQSVLTKPLPGLQPYRESLELSRFCLLDEVPANAESWFLARGFEMAATAGIRGVVSFSDPMPRRRVTPAGVEVTTPGHVGVIYQATNATYTGRATPRSLILLPDGSSLPARSAQKVRADERGARGVERRLVALGATVRRPGQDGAVWLAAALREIGVERARHRGVHRYIFRIGNRRERSRVTVALPALPYPKQPDQPAGSGQLDMFQGTAATRR